MNLEHIDKALERLLERRQELGRQIAQTVPAPKVFSQYQKCSRDNCRCQKGQGHGPYYYASVRVGDEVRKLYLGKDRKVEGREFPALQGKRIIGRGERKKLAADLDDARKLELELLQIQNAVNHRLPEILEEVERMGSK